MRNSYNKIGVLSGSTLKIIACVLMAIDHVGLVLFPNLMILRIIGRLSFPIFAFFIAEGCKYTKNKPKRFLMLFGTGTLFVLFYYIYNGELYGNIFMTFSVSVLIIYLLQWTKKCMLCTGEIAISILAIILLLSAFIGTYALFDIVYFEYGYFGMLLPVFASLFDLSHLPVSDKLKRFDTHPLRMLAFAIGLIPLSILGRMGDIQFYCFFALIPLALYNGKQGNKKLKYSFYLFYPAHLIIIEAIALLINYI